MIALVVDLGNARQQRRVAQASADAAALAGGEAIESGMDRVDRSRSRGRPVVTQIKNYAKANDNIPPSAWVGCTDPYKLAYRPDSANSNSCISATDELVPAPSSSSVGNNINYLRVRLPVVDGEELLRQGDRQRRPHRRRELHRQGRVHRGRVADHALVAGWPVRALHPQPDGFTLDGQNGDVTITDGNVVVNSTSGTAASLNPNGHVKITTVGGSIGGPGSCVPAACNNFSGAGFSPAWSQQGDGDRLANVPQCGDGSPGTVELLPDDEPDRRLERQHALPGIYSEIKNSHTLSPGSTCSPAASP